MYINNDLVYILLNTNLNVSNIQLILYKFEYNNYIELSIDNGYL